MHRVLEELGRIEVNSETTSSQFQNLVIGRLVALGAEELETEYHVPYFGAGEIWRRGRVDIRCRVEGDVIALELDNMTPRRKSVFKLQSMKDADVKAVVCRGQPAGHAARIVVVADRTPVATSP